MGKKKVVPVEYSGAKKLMAPFEKNVEKKEQTLSAPKKVLKEEKAKKETQSDLDKYQKTFDDISSKLGNMRNVNSKSGGRKVFSDKDISVYTARIKNVGKILARLYEKRGELDKMYEVRSRVSNALLAQEEDAAPRSIQGISIPNSIRRETNRDLDEAHYRADADNIAKKYIDKEYSEDGNDVKDFMNRFGANYAAAKLGTKSSKGGYDYAQNPTSAREYYNDTVEKIQQQFAGRNSGIVGKGGVISKNLASYLPQLEGQIDYGVQGVVAVGGTAALTGNPKLALGAAKYGYALGSGIYSYEQMYGDSFNKFSKMTDFDTAKKMAHDEGLLSGGVEGIDTLTDIAGLGYGKLLKVLGKESVEKMAKDSIYKVLGKYAANVLGEGGQEGLQELISIANERRLEKGATDSGVSGLVEETITLIGEIAKGENEEAFKRAKESGIEGMKTAAVIGAPAAAINTMATNAIIDEKSGSKKAENTDDVLYQIEYDAENVPFVVVENDILEGLDTKQKEAKVKDVLKERFQRGVQVGNNLIRVNKMTRNEVVNSKYSQTLKRNNPELYDAKLNALTETEDVLKASRNYVNEERKHARKDNVIDFARGTVNLRIGNKDYKAEIVVGTTIGNNLVLYDVVGLDTAVISDKKTKSFSRADVVAEKSRYQQSAKNSYEAQSPNGSKAEQKKTAGGASASISNIPQNAKNINKNITDFDKVIAMGDNDYAETVRKRIQNAENQDDVLNSIESVGSVGKSGITYDDMMSGNITEEVREQKESFEGAVGRAGFKVIYATDRNVPKGTIGYVDFKNKEIYISPEHFSESLLNHELTHVIDRGYDGKYVKSLISFFKEEMSKEWNDAEQAIRDKYEKIAEENPGFAYDERTIEAETLAEMCVKFSTDKYIKNAANMKTGTVRQIAVMFRYMWSKMRYHFGDNSEARKMKIASMKWQMALYRAVQNGAVDGGSGTLFMHVGEKSKTANRSLLNRAKEMSIKGDDASVIWRETGWRLGADGKWRFEINDRYAELLVVPEGTKSVKLGEIFLHDELYKAYPQLESMEVIFSHMPESEGTAGMYHPGEKKIYITSDMLSGDSMTKFNDECKGLFIHEIQHAIQDVEGFEFGGSPARALQLERMYAADYLWNNDNVYRGMVESGSVGVVEAVSYIDNYLAEKYNVDKDMLEDTAYERLMGEREAQDARHRADLDVEERKDIFPDYDKGALLWNEHIEKDKPVLRKKNTRTVEATTDQKLSTEGNNKRYEGKPDDLRQGIEEEIGIIDEALQDKTLDKEDRMNLIKDRIRLKRELSEVAGEKKEDKPSRREKVLEEYRETKDVGVLPDRDEIRAAESYDKKKISEYRKEFAEIQEALRNQEDLSADDVEELKMRRDAVVTALNRLSENNSVLSKIEGILDELGVVEEPDHRWVSDIAEELSDKQNIIKYGTYNQNDIERNFRHFFGKHFKKAYDKVIQPLYDSKKRYVEGVNEYAEKLKADVVDKLGIKKGTRESAAVMWLGEGKRPLSKKELINIHGKEKANRLIAEAKAEGQSEVFIKYTYEDCKKDFGEDVARNIQKATEVFRKMYDELIADVNKTRAELYPNNPDKLVKKRKDYFHHFQEMSKGFEGLRNILNTNIGIDPMLVGTSEHTKPKSKWQAYMQERVGNRTVYDAVEGFIRYLPAAQYSIHIDPNIVNVRGLARELALAKASEYSEHGNPDANGFIAYLQKYANSLAGKTVSHFDRAINDSNFGRTATAVVGWLNNKTKASAVLGNINSVLSQVTNMKNVIGKIENQADFVRGAIDALGGLNPDGKISARYKESGFLGERYLDRSFSKFDTKWQKMNPVKWAADVLGYADEIGTRITWNAGYNEAIRKNIANPVQYADNFTRACVAGRGIGEEALVFKSQLGKMFLPFRTEVLNDLRVQQDILFGKDDDGKSVAVGKRIKNIMQLYIASMVINAALAALKSDEFDPIEEAEEGFEDGGIFGALGSVLRDYADGTGDPVAFDPIYDIVTGIYQGINEGESAGGKVGKSMQRTVQNIAGDYVSNNPFSSAAMGIVGIDSDASDMLFNGKVYSPGGMGMPLASNLSTVFRELSQGDEGSAVAAAVKPFLPLGTQIDRSAKGLYDYHKGYATSESVYERIAGEDGDLKYLIEKTPGNFAKSLLFGPGSFSGESDAFYNDKTRKFTDKEQAAILSKSDYDSRKVTFDEILAGRVYDSEEEERKTLVAEEFFRGDEDSILYEIYSSGEDAALPYRNMGVSASFTDDKTDKKYKLKLSAKEAEKITDEMCTVIAKRFDRANESDVFNSMTREEQVKYLDGVKNAEYEFAKISALHDKGKMSDEDFFRFESNYKKCEAERDRALYVDDVSLYVEYNVADTVGQYASYTDVPISEEGYEQLRAWSEYASNRTADDVDRELMRLSNETGSSINVAGNPYGIINYTKNKVEYKISMPDNKIYALCYEVDKAVRSGLSKLFATTAYLNASAEVQKDLVASVKSKVRADIKDKYKVKYKSVKIDDFDKVINMGK